MRRGGFVTILSSATAESKLQDCMHWRSTNKSTIEALELDVLVSGRRAAIANIRGAPTRGHVFDPSLSTFPTCHTETTILTQTCTTIYYSTSRDLAKHTTNWREWRQRRFAHRHSPASSLNRCCGRRAVLNSHGLDMQLESRSAPMRLGPLHSVYYGQPRPPYR